MQRGTGVTRVCWWFEVVGVKQLLVSGPDVEVISGLTVWMAPAQ